MVTIWEHLSINTYLYTLLVDISWWVGWDETSKAWKSNGLAGGTGTQHRSAAAVIHRQRMNSSAFRRRQLRTHHGIWSGDGNSYRGTTS